MILSGTAVANTVLEKIHTIIERQHITPKLGIVLVGSDPASQIYVKRKNAVAASVGIAIELHALSDSTTAALVALIKKMNTDQTVHGILVQLPLPTHINTQTVINALDPKKDIDGFHPQNIRNGVQTPVLLQAISWLLRATRVNLKNKAALLIGKSDIFLEPMAAALKNFGLQVSLCKPDEITSEKTRQADVLLVAIGAPQTIKKEHVRPGAIIVDIGINRLPNGQVVGDVDFASVEPIASWITPTPGGVGPVTIAAAMWNTLLAALRAANLRDSFSDTKIFEAE